MIDMTVIKKSDPQLYAAMDEELKLSLIHI